MTVSGSITSTILLEFLDSNDILLSLEKAVQARIFGEENGSWKSPSKLEAAGKPNGAEPRKGRWESFRFFLATKSLKTPPKKLRIF